MELLLVRHAEPLRVEDVDHADPDLSPQGRRQAEALARWWRGRRIDVAYTGPAKRASQTARLVTAPLGVPLQVDDRLTEFDWGAREYVPFEQARRTRPELVARLTESFAGGGPEAVAWRERVVGVCEELTARHRGERVAVFCHGGIVATYLTHVAGGRATAFATDYTGVTSILASAGGERTVRACNDTGHLAALAGATVGDPVIS